MTRLASSLLSVPMSVFRERTAASRTSVSSALQRISSGVSAAVFSAHCVHSQHLTSHFFLV